MKSSSVTCAKVAPCMVAEAADCAHCATTIVPSFVFDKVVCDDCGVIVRYE